ncbi:MAG TPA: hypothetical protein EYG66_07080 [Mariprofundaceae bacterium]|nr:hypothetical protein [Mariprofundaceae bacterium]
MEYEALLRLDTRLKAILGDAKKLNGLHSILLADENGLSVSYSGEIESPSIAAIAPELIRVGEKATSLGCYNSMSCVMVMLENSHLLIIKTITIHKQKFVVVMDAPLAPKGLSSMLIQLKEDISKAIKVDKKERIEE